LISALVPIGIIILLGVIALVVVLCLKKHHPELFKGGRQKANTVVVQPEPLSQPPPSQVVSQTPPQVIYQPISQPVYVVYQPQLQPQPQPQPLLRLKISVMLFLNSRNQYCVH